MPTPKVALLLVNPKAGKLRANAAISAASRHFREPTWRLFVHPLVSPEESYVLAKDAAAKRFACVLVAGGDGTVNEVARALIGKQTTLGLIPTGTGNGFARGLGIPLNLDRACAALASGKVRNVDVGIVADGRIFVNVLGAGFDAWVATDANRLRWVTRISGFLRYFAAGLRGALSFRGAELEIRSGKRIERGRYLLASVSNGEQYGMGLRSAPGAVPDDGVLDVVLYPLASPLTMLASSLDLFRNRLPRGAVHFRASQVEIRSSQDAMPVHVDGEPAGTLPAVIQLKKRALRMLVPR